VPPKASRAGLICRTDQCFQCQRLPYTCSNNISDCCHCYGGTHVRKSFTSSNHSDRSSNDSSRQLFAFSWLSADLGLIPGPSGPGKCDFLGHVRTQCHSEEKRDWIMRRNDLTTLTR